MGSLGDLLLKLGAIRIVFKMLKMGPLIGRSLFVGTHLLLTGWAALARPTSVSTANLNSFHDAHDSPRLAVLHFAFINSD